MAKSTLDTKAFRRILDDFILTSEVQIRITLPAGVMDAKVEDNLGFSPTIQLYILLQALENICGSVSVSSMVDEEKWLDCISRTLKLIERYLLGPGQ